LAAGYLFARCSEGLEIGLPVEIFDPASVRGALPEIDRFSGDFSNGAQEGSRPTLGVQFLAISRGLERASA
jgi:hypothetical protein